MTKIISLFVMYFLCWSNVNKPFSLAQEKYISIDWSNFPETEAEETKAENIPILIRDYGTCICNLTPFSCDFSCCCDLDCTNEQRLQYLCTNDQSKNNLPSVTPNVTNPLLRYFDNFLQVHTEITPYLGEFYSHQEIIRSILTYSETIVKENITRQIPLTLDTLDASEYKYGSAVKVINEYGEPKSLLTPQHSGPGTSCTNGSPVMFGISSDSNCLRTVNRDQCRNGTLLDAIFYIGSETGFNVLTSPGVNGTDISSRVRFNCTTGSTLVTGVSSEIVNILSNDSSVSFDDPSTCRALSPIYDETTNTCKNVAQQVSYQFIWKGQLITDLLIDVNTADIHLNDGFLQKFDVKWVYSSAEANQDVFPSHGFYTIGSVVYATSLELPRTNATTLLIPNTPKRYKILKSSVDGSCNSAHLEDTKFGTNAESSCFLPLSRSDFKDCSAVRDKVTNIFQPILANTYFTKNLKVNGTSVGLDSLVEILKENFLTAGTLDDFPSPNRFPLNDRTWPTSCYFIPAVLTIWVQYAEIAHINGTSVYEIVGSLKTFENLTWVYKSHEEPSRFFLTNRILFTMVPANIVPVKRFFLNKDNSPSCLNAPTLSVCWNELFYPFTSEQNYEEHVYSTVVGLGTVLIVIATYFVTKPWW